MFDLKKRMDDISKQGDPLEKLNNAVNWEQFRKVLTQVIPRKDRSKGGRPPFDHVLMFKILVIQSLYNLSDDQTEYQIKDRLSFMRFLGLSLKDTVPDSKTVWLYREKLGANMGVQRLFEKLNQMLTIAGFYARSGQIIDASIIETPKSRISKKDKETIKSGGKVSGWSNAKKEQIDHDARWTVKGDIPYFGYKNHINIDKKYRLIRNWKVTDAATHDSRAFESVFDFQNSGLPIFADAAYRSSKIEKFIIKCGRVSKIQWRKPPNKELTHFKKWSNSFRSKTRGVVEHVFGKQKSQMGLFVRTIGIKRAEIKIGMANLVYNLTKMELLQRANKFLTA